MASVGSKPVPKAAGDARPKLSKRASSSVSFFGQLKHLQSPPLTAPTTPDEEYVTNSRGEIVRIKNSGIIHSLTEETSQQKLVATLYYNPRRALIALGGESDEEITRHDATYVTDMAIFEFTQMIDELIVPYKNNSSSTKILSDSEQPTVVEVLLSMPSLLQLDELRRHYNLLRFEQRWSIDVVLQPNDVFRRYKRMVVFDMDSTLIQQEVIDELAAFVGVKDKVSAITERAMNGEIDFTESLKQRVALLRGVPGTVWEDMKKIIKFTDGARELTRALKKLGFKMAVISGGFLPLAEYVKSELGLDYAYANQLVTSEDGKVLTGELIGDVVNAERKEELLTRLASENDISLNQTLAIGDGANDLKMMKKAGLGIAFNAKPTVQVEAPCRINSGSLQDVLYVLGFNKEEQNELIA